MVTGLKKNNLTQKLATGAAALGVLAGVGLASAPAQAGVFTLQPKNILPDPPGPGDFVDSDSEWGFPGSEPIWSTWPNSTNIPNPAGGPAGGPGEEGCRHGITPDCVNGWDNALVTYTPLPGVPSTFKIEFFGSGNSTQTNNFLWNGVPLFPPPNFPSTATNDACGPKENPATDNFGTPCAMTTVAAVAGALPFAFTTNLPVPGVTVNNGDTPSDDGTNVTGAHYFATLKGTWADLTDSNVVYLGFSDGNNNQSGSDDDAADFVVKITSVKQAPEPGTVLGLLAVGGLGAFMKRKKQG